LGAVALDLTVFLENPDKVVDDWFPLTGVNKKLGAATGELRVRVTMELEGITAPAPPLPKRKLQVVALEARDLQAADSGGTSDPFAVAHVGGVKPIKTKVIKKTLCPKWNETLKMTLPAGTDEPLKVQVYDHDQFGSNDFLGEIVIPLLELEIGEVIDKWYDLEPREGRDEVVSGSIHLQVTMTPEE
jgi:Ca2+-dependent lipid-binding protein